VLSDDAFAAVRDRVLSQSPSASPTDQAREHVEARERAIINAAQKASEPPEPATPAEFRVKKTRPAPEPKTSAGYRTKRSGRASARSPSCAPAPYRTKSASKKTTGMRHLCSGRKPRPFIEPSLSINKR
jgi:hypothetical protein